MKTLYAILLLAMAGAPAAQTPEAQPSAKHSAAPAAASSSEMSRGEVRRIDRAQRKITLRHGEMKRLAMPPMTMVFRVKDAAQLDMLKVGDRVSFRAEKIDGVFTVTAIEPSP